MELRYHKRDSFGCLSDEKNKSYSLDARRKPKTILFQVITGLDTVVIEDVVVINDETGVTTDVVLIKEAEISPRCRHILTT